MRGTFAPGVLLDAKQVRMPFNQSLMCIGPKVDLYVVQPSDWDSWSALKAKQICESIDFTYKQIPSRLHLNTETGKAHVKEPKEVTMDTPYFATLEHGSRGERQEPGLTTDAGIP